jgi:hypothetical protein
MSTRIEPKTDDDGRPVELTPPAGGSWLRDADGGLTPANEPTAIGAGLDWPAAEEPAPKWKPVAHDTSEA